MNWYRWDNEKLILSLLVQPRASRDEFVVAPDSICRVRLTAPPVDGRANAHLVAFLAQAFGVKSSAIDLISGVKGRRKVVCIHKPIKIPELMRLLIQKPDS
ncbi:hypothetical protein TI04_12565 [Achromatium sp. WMS2]|nr:hypothetical protein TI04_12565 [Achromatium sp. WMS2]